jgi:hypothetical protein
MVRTAGPRSLGTAIISRLHLFHIFAHLSLSLIIGFMGILSALKGVKESRPRPPCS